MKKEIYTTREAAEVIGVHSMTVKRWVAAGKMNAIRMSVQFAFDAAEVERVIQERNAKKTVAA